MIKKQTLPIFFLIFFFFSMLNSIKSFGQDEEGYCNFNSPSSNCMTASFCCFVGVACCVSGTSVGICNVDVWKLLGGLFVCGISSYGAAEVYEDLNAGVRLTENRIKGRERLKKEEKERLAIRPLNKKPQTKSKED